ncbi:MAG: protein translocase subunit SecF [Microbacterium sp.]
MRSMNELGNDLYTGKTSFPFVQKRRLWFILAIVLVAISALVPFVRGVEWSIEFTGGSQFTISHPETMDQLIASDVVADTIPGSTASVTAVGGENLRVQTTQLDNAQTQSLTTALADAYGVEASEITSSYIGPSWGADVTKQSLWGLGIFLALTFLILALYFRTWKMSVAAIVGLVDVLVITIGVYALAGFEISPAAVIGFLTILAYSLYDTTVVFDKVRENTRDDGEVSDRTFGESVNLGVNQTLVRSINTSVVAALPVAAILFIGALWLGADTLSDISLSIFVGILVATYSTLFVAAPLYALLRQGEPAIRQRDARVLAARERSARTAA